MKTSFKLQIGIFLLLVLAVLVGVLVFQHSLVNKKPSSQAPSSVIFQPEGQMLNQAIDPKNASGPPASSDQSTAASQNVVGYTYDKSTCAGSTTLYLCLADYYNTVEKKFGSTVAINDLKQRGAENSSVLSDCHPLMHVIGRAAAANYTTVSDAFAHGDVYCWSGYYHGILEGMVAKIGLKNLPTELDKICADIPGKATYTFEYYNCVHGLGHGIMAQLGDEVFQSLKMCDNLTGSWEQQSCYGGVFMQNIIDSTNVADTDNVVKYLKPSDPMYPCTAVDDKYKGQCYLGQTSYALQVSNYDFKKVSAMCATVAEPYRDICFQSLGRDAANQAYHQAEGTKKTCALGVSANDVTNCVVGAVKEIISYYHSETQALGFCDVLDGNDKFTCKTTADSYYTVFQ